MKETKKNEVTWEEKYRKRKESNLKIIEILKEMAESFPDWRFFQILCNMGYDTNPDRFHEESFDTLQQMEAVLSYLTKKQNNHD